MNFQVFQNLGFNVKTMLHIGPEMNILALVHQLILLMELKGNGM